MLGALLYLKLASIGGLLRSRLLRLKQPKYLIGAIVGAAYIFFFFIRPGRYGRRPQATDFPEDALPLIATVGALGLLLVLAASWVLPRRSAGLTFSEAEIAFLFPAPIRRRTLIHFRLISSQVGLALTALILTLLSNRWTFLGGNALTHAIGWWLILATLNLHFTASAFVILQLTQRGVSSLRRRLTALAIVLALIAASVVWIIIEARPPGPADFATPDALKNYALELTTTGAMPWLLAIPKLLIAPFLAADVRTFLVTLLPAFAVLAAHYFWVMRSEVGFEEASVAKAEKRAARLAAIREGRTAGGSELLKSQPPPFRLAPTGRVEIAFLWKNLISAPRFFRPRPVLITAAIIVGACTWLAGRPDLQGLLVAVYGMASMTAAFTLLLGPQIARNDLRADLLNTDILKTYPLRGWQIVLGELLTPIAMLTALLWLELLAIALTFPTKGFGWLTPELQTAILVSLAVVAVPFCALQLLVPNAVTVLFPAWMQAVGNRSEHGLDVLGQRIIFIAGQAFIAVVALLPAALAAALLFFGSRWLLGAPLAAALAAAGVFAVLATEFWFGLRWLGGRFEAFDLSSELRP
jgi:ABC-2 type transport system permease protein